MEVENVFTVKAKRVKEVAEENLSFNCEYILDSHTCVHVCMYVSVYVCLCSFVMAEEICYSSFDINNARTYLHAYITYICICA